MTAVYYWGWEPYEASGTSISVSFAVFTDLVANDAIVVHLVVADASTAFDTPSGWELMAVSPGAAGAVASFYRDADGTETSQTFTWDVSQAVLAIAQVFSTATLFTDAEPLMWAGVVTQATTGTTHNVADIVPVWPCGGASADDAIHVVIGMEGGFYDPDLNTTGMALDGEPNNTAATLAAGLYNRAADSDGTYDPGSQTFDTSADRFSIGFAIRVRCADEPYLGMLAHLI